MLISESVLIKWHQNNRKHYELKGYLFTKYGNEFIVNISDLLKSSKVKIKVKCDYCNTIIDRTYKDYNMQNLVIQKDSCKDCFTLKMKDVCMFKYGVSNVNKLVEVKQKKIDTCRANFGVDHPGQSEEITEKMKQSRMENLGVEWAMQNKEVRRKTKVSLYDNETGACSKPQKYLCNLLNGKLNYPIENCSVDILIQNNIIIEYNGGGHDRNVHAGVVTRKEFDNIERKRDYFLKTKGYKIIKIISPRDYLPPDDKILELIIEAINYMGSNKRNHYNIEIGDKMIDINYGQLRRITEKDIENQESEKGSFLFKEVV